MEKIGGFLSKPTHSPKLIFSSPLSLLAETSSFSSLSIPKKKILSPMLLYLLSFHWGFNKENSSLKLRLASSISSSSCSWMWSLFSSLPMLPKMVTMEEKGENHFWTINAWFYLLFPLVYDCLDWNSPFSLIFIFEDPFSNVWKTKIYMMNFLSLGTHGLV